ncbi:Gfo/Idh/MocA family protein [Homoserinibacter sp. YIM 151385]|uniref:Gfo/Idh/MocA family protein n=1 Tax=Homoserinibacter sp. YIM 151385 TaxID=2985506 RepID=UPI0022F0741A|nr:Gfo/Idh/MocA family oxidoreductase [Homoserinibacter sp. YIM 151385]WBU36934.1 Gfo/Idh/MocA family oxidoreductase [Homoserinibacter sp. YIM 151385]
MSAAASGQVGVGIIGAGVISGQYLDNLTSFADVEVRFIADLDLARAQAQAEAYGVAGHGTVDELLAREDVEIVVNLTIPAVHVEVGLQIVAAGKHVWSEKPIALDRESGRRLLDAAAAAGVRVACAPDTFLGAGLQTAFRALAAGEIGQPLTALAAAQSAGPESWHPNPAFLFDTGAGPLFDIGPYYLTALVQIFGPVSRVSATASTARPSRTIGSGPLAGTDFPVVVPSHHAALLEFESGASAQAIFSFDTHIAREAIVEVGGSAGGIELPDPNTFEGASTLWQPGEPGRELDAEGSTWGRGSGVVDLARAIRAGVPERASGELAFHVLDVMVSIADAAARGRAVDVASTVGPQAPLPADWDPSAATL